MRLSVKKKVLFILAGILSLGFLAYLTPHISIQWDAAHEPNQLLHYFETNQKRAIHKWMHYFEIYERYFAKFKNTDVTVVEVGVAQGGSLQMWKNYFGPKARIIGVDIDERCKQAEEAQIEVFIGDQASDEFWSRFKERVPKVDILIDDGGHEMHQQIATFRAMFPHISSNGVYVCEDLHTSYWDGYGGGYQRPGTFIEMSKNLIDELNAWHFRRQDEISDFTRTAYALHYYDSMLIIEKRPMQPSHAEEKGVRSF